ncbi:MULTISPECIES: hypothetical protein [Methanobacterium]|uniref:Uncharacterized protein n=1 Tax=Methanobacterium veterum TaxID=408577 RepID=A0A9E4ZYN2_9EURY|nr:MULTISPECIES: hypothetical protein [Methanobacterium]MCZ3366737.1 hypothetical protein [Methanobacterium veterum]MCZ3374117.1 hypothetical protein [Methanobacterium veterum]
MVSEERAKELFFSYYGNEFFMWKDGDLDEYKSYNISKDQELIWKDELIDKLCSKLDVKHNSSLNGLILIINYFGEYDLLKKVLYFISDNYSEADSFLKLKYAEELFDIIEKSKFHEHAPEDTLLETKKFIIVIINDILSNKIKISAESEKILEFNRDMSDEKYLVMRTRDLLKKIEFYGI